MPEAEPVRVAAVGLGWVTTHRHIPAVRRCSAARLLGVIDHQQGRAEAAAQALNLRLSATAETAAEVAWLEQVDAVTIGTPPTTHYKLARGYLDAGKHVLLEKPMAMSVKEAENLASLAIERGRVLAVMHNFQFSRSVRRTTEVLRSGSLGDVRSVWGVQLSNPRRRLPSWYEELPLGLFYDESPHFFYLIRALAPPAHEFRSIDVVGGANGVSTPRKIAATLNSDGILIQLDMNFEAPVSEWLIAILGSERIAIIDIFRDIVSVLPNDQKHLGRDILRTSVGAGWAHFAGTFKSGLLVAAGRLDYGTGEVVRRFIAACQGKSGELNGISPADGIAVVEMQHRVINATQ